MGVRARRISSDDKTTGSEFELCALTNRGQKGEDSIKRSVSSPSSSLWLQVLASLRISRRHRWTTRASVPRPWVSRINSTAKRALSDQLSPILNSFIDQSRSNSKPDLDQASYLDPSNLDSSNSKRLHRYEFVAYFAWNVYPSVSNDFDFLNHVDLF